MKKQTYHTMAFLAFFLLSMVASNALAQNKIESREEIKATYVKNATFMKSVKTDALMNWAKSKSYNKSINEVKKQIAQVKSYSRLKNNRISNLNKGNTIVSSKTAVEDYVLELELFRLELIVTITENFHSTHNLGNSSRKTVRQLINELAHPYKGYITNKSIKLPTRVPRQQVTSLAFLDNEIRFWNSKLNALDNEEESEEEDDDEILQVRMQSSMQHRSQTVTMATQMLKSINDSSNRIAQNIGR